MSGALASLAASQGEAPAGMPARIPCACGRQAALWLYATRQGKPIAPCSRCAVELIEMGWTPEPSELP